MKKSRDKLYLKLAALILLPICALTTNAKNKTNYIGTCSPELKQQQEKRFPSGSVFYLPQTVGFFCTPTQWKLVKSPTGNTADIVSGIDGYDRITPLAPGDYEFVSTANNAIKHVSVIDYRDIPFENYNYYPTNSMTIANDNEIWVTSTFTGEISRVDMDSMQVLGSIPVGPWPVAVATSNDIPWVLVAHKANDTIGYVDKTSGTLVDSIWVGDEPGNIIIGPSAQKAFVALSTDDQIAVIDIATKAVIKKIDVGIDPLAMSIDESGNKLFVASKRSGQPSRAPFGEDPVEDEKDITIVDLNTMEVEGYVIDVASTINDISFNPRDGRLYVLNLRNNPQQTLVRPELKAFIHELSVIDIDNRAKVAEIDLSRQSTSSGPAISLQRMILTDDTIWIISEGQNQLIALDAQTFEEQLRIDVSGFPRNILLDNDRIFVHEHQNLALSQVSLSSEASEYTQYANDPRDPMAAFGQRTFTGAGVGYGAYFSCNQCHMDSTNDSLVWPAGPFRAAFVPRPHFWLEGTAPLGWTGYSASVESFGFEAHSIIGIVPSTEQTEALTAYLSSMVPPPAANTQTNRDGSLSLAGKFGEFAFQFNTCSACHALPLAADLRDVDEGVTVGEANIPSLVGIYRYKNWLKHGEASTLEDAVRAAVDKFGSPFTSEYDIKALTRYMEELTSRDFFLLNSTPAENENAASISPNINLTFSHSVFDDPDNLANIKIYDWWGREQNVQREANGRYVSLSVDEPLEYDTYYFVEIKQAFESFQETQLYRNNKVVWFKTLSEPEISLSGNYQLRVDFPFFDIPNGQVDPDRTQPVFIPVNAEPNASGADIEALYRPNLVKRKLATIDGVNLDIPPLPVPAGPFSFADGFSGFKAELQDSDGDGIGDFANGTMRLSGPGFKADGVTWSLTRIN